MGCRQCAHTYTVGSNARQATMCAFSFARCQRFRANLGQNAESARHSQRCLATHIFIGQLLLCETSFIMTEILIRSQHCSFFFGALADSSWGRVRNRVERQQIEGGLRYEGAGLHYSTVLRQILNENPREGDSSLYLIKPL